MFASSRYVLDKLDIVFVDTSCQRTLFFSNEDVFRRRQWRKKDGIRPLTPLRSTAVLKISLVPNYISTHGCCLVRHAGISTFKYNWRCQSIVCEDSCPSSLGPLSSTSWGSFGRSSSSGMSTESSYQTPGSVLGQIRLCIQYVHPP